MTSDLESTSRLRDTIQQAALVIERAEEVREKIRAATDELRKALQAAQQRDGWRV
jgi:hypothetical protein